MKLEILLENIDVIKISGNRNLNIEGIFYDSRSVKKNSIFVCLVGLNVDGHKYIKNAINNGAIAIVVSDENYYPANPLSNVTFIMVTDTRKVIAILSWNFFGRVWEKMKVIGITGTNGKTSTSILLKSILENNGNKTGLIGTMFYMVDREKISATRTTPESSDLGKLFQKMINLNSEYVVMEVTSHAISLERIYGMKFHKVVFTNLTHDHLDFHVTLDNYRNTKFRLFEMIEDEPSTYSIIANQDDPSSSLIPIELNDRILTFGLTNNSKVYPVDLKLTTSDTKFNLVTPEENIPIDTRLIGKTNVYNILAAASVAYSLKIPLDCIAKGIKNVNRIPGRMDAVDMEQDFDVFIDYAHTPDALHRALSGLREICSGRIITVFGCGGDRDKTKRPLMGSISARNSDFSIITNDNPRTENPSEIIEQIKKGFEKENVEDYIIESDREKAIILALDHAKRNDTVLIAGKGHENYQIIGEKVLKFDDRECVIKLLKGRN